MYPDDMPPELLAAQPPGLNAEEPPEAGTARAELREVELPPGMELEPPASDAPKEPPKRGHLRLVK